MTALPSGTLWDLGRHQPHGGQSPQRESNPWSLSVNSLQLDGGTWGDGVDLPQENPSLPLDPDLEDASLLPSLGVSLGCCTDPASSCRCLCSVSLALALSNSLLPCLPPGPPSPIPTRPALPALHTPQLLPPLGMGLPREAGFLRLFQMANRPSIGN